MKRFLPIAAATVGLAALGHAQTTKHTLLFNSRYNPAESLDAMAKTGLRVFRSQDILAVTPGANATAFPVQTSATTAAQWGDAQDDNMVNDFKSGVVSSGLVGPFVKWDDKKNFDSRNVYWTVKIRAQADVGAYSVWTRDSQNMLVKHDMRTGDFVKIKANGEAEFFITQDLIMKAAGMQTGSWVPGTVAICQDKDKNLYYAAPHSLSNANTLAGGHWVDNANSRVFVFDSGVIKIPKEAITYDRLGNVSDVTAGSSVLVFNEINGSATNLTTRDMIGNAKHIDDLGLHDNVSFWMTGIEIDPSTTGTFKGWDGKDTPHLIFTIVRTAFRSNGSWKTTIFSTQPNNNILGSVAKINGQLMGSVDPMKPADGAWMGLKDKVGSSQGPILNGLQFVETTLNETAPYGITAAGTSNADGIVTIGTDPNINLALQGELLRLPIALLHLTTGVAKGGQQLSLNVASIVGGYGNFYIPITALFPPGGSVDTKGQIEINFPTPNDNALKDTRLIWQAFFVAGGGKLSLTPPIQTEFR